uniref:Uncharacterized protein n=1 Tax=Setaria italica TaxID=4555 RepID=K4AI22_SETIT
MGLSTKGDQCTLLQGPSCMVNIRRWYGAPAASN